MFFFSSRVLGDGKLILLRFVVVVFDFRSTSDYTMANNMFFLIIDSIMG
jgi:hypothetical protein